VITTSRPRSIPLPRVLWATATARHPEWWLTALAAAAWVPLLLGWPLSSSSGSHAHHDTGPSVVAALAFWLVMVVAMMGPGLLAEVRHLAFTSIGRRRNRAIAGFLGGYLALWLVLGVVVIAGVASGLMGRLAADRAALGFAVAWSAVAAWQLSPTKRIALRACLRSTPVRGHGLDADVACLRAGAANGLWCAVSCGPAMVALVLTGHPLPLTVGLTAGLAAEKVVARGFRLVPWVAAGIVVLAGLSFA